jgi:MFS family permease
MIWFILFFGGAIVPPATGISISCVPKEIRSFASAGAQFITNIFGYSLAPLVAGGIADVTNLTWGFRSIIFVSAFALSKKYTSCSLLYQLLVINTSILS